MRKSPFHPATTVEEFLDDPGVTLDLGLLGDICKRIIALEQPDPERVQLNAIADRLERHILEAKS